MNTTVDYFDHEVFDEQIESGMFCIDSAAKADWAIEKIVAHRKERDRLVNTTQMRIDSFLLSIAREKERCEEKTARLLSHLYEYFRTVPHEKSKTQEKYRLVSGDLIEKKPTVKYDHNEEMTLAFLLKNGMESYVKTKLSLDWEGLKKLVRVGDFDDEGRAAVMIAETGEIVPGIVAVEKPGSFDIKER